MSFLTRFVLPLIAGMGVYYLLLILFPSLNEFEALLVGLLTAWVIWALIRRLEPSLEGMRSQR
jgi:hypothetical protein